MASERRHIEFGRFVATAVFVGVAASSTLAQAPWDGPAGGPPSASHPRTIAAPAGLNDMLQPLVSPAAPVARPATVVGDATKSAPAASVPLSERLRAWDADTRANARLQVELPAGVPPAIAALAQQVELAWNAGQYEAALANLQWLEASSAPVALGVAWRTPRPGGAEREFTDVRIGTRTGGVTSALDYDAASEKLFAVVRWDSDNGWALNMSTNGGSTWSETYFWYAGSGLNATSLDMVVVGGYVYVAYVSNMASYEARLRRCFVSTGLADTEFDFTTVFDAGLYNTVTEVKVTSDADWSNGQIYCAARQSNNAVRYAWDLSSSGKTFTEVSPAGAAAVGGLDLCGNPGFATYYAFLSYIGTDSQIHVWRRSGSVGWNEATTTAFDGTHNRTSISAWDDHVICAHELQMTHGQGIRYFITHDGGATWDYYNYIGEPLAGEGPYQMADVTARGGQGTAITFTHETGEPDDVLMRYRRNYSPGVWHAAIRVNNHDVSTGTWTTLNWTPPDTAHENELSYGMIYFFGSTPYYNRFQQLVGDLNCDGAVDFDDINAFVLALAGAAGYEAVYPECDVTLADCNGDGSVDFDDINAFVAILSGGD